MRSGNNTIGDLVILHDEKFLERQRIAGKVTASTLSLLENLVKEKANLSLSEMDKMADEHIRKNSCEPTFYMYKGFPSHCCFSVNKQLVHGVATNYKLKDGDIISFDLGATYEGAIADSAITCIFGDPVLERHSILVKDTQRSLYKGIQAAKTGNRLGAIGSAIWHYARSKGWGVITHYGGHGLEYNKPHANPFVANKGEPDAGLRLLPNMTLAIEPMLTSGSTKTWVDEGDKWTVWCEADCSGHFEHSIFIHEDRVEVLTKRDGEEICPD